MSAIRDFLHPIDETMLISNSESIGSRVKIYFEEKDLKDNVVLIGCSDLRGSISSKEYSNLRLIREELYKLVWGKWNFELYDLGDIIPGEKYEDTLYALQQVLEELIDLGVEPIILGGSISLNYATYRALGKYGKPLNFSLIDSSIEVDMVEERITDKSFLSKMMVEEPNLLFNFANVGYQTYFVKESVLRIFEGLDFENIRLGNAVNNIKDCEPIFRGGDFAGINLDAIESYTGSLSVNSSVNGFTNREICKLGRYIGMSKQIKVIGIFNFLGSLHNKMDGKLVSQVLWYIIEGKGQQQYYEEDNYIKYIVLHEDEEMIFLKDKNIDRWWLAVNLKTEEQPTYLLPCSHKDYKEAMEGNVPDKYWKAFKRFL